ncbi:MAG: glycosyltransferase family 4 protein [Planctomycetota bacterium]
MPAGTSRFGSATSAGGGTLEQMRALAGELGVGDRVHFRGVLPGGKAIMDAIDTFDLFLCATACEGLPRVVIEAMARGCPCIGSDIGGIPELLEPTHLVVPADVDSLAERISQVLADPVGVAASVERNVEVARRYTTDQLEPRRTALYRELRERTERWRTGGAGK